MPVILKHVIMNGVRVPLAEDGRPLDWRKEHRGRAPALTSPYGPDHFRVGTASLHTTLDYAELPDGDFVLDVVDGGFLLVRRPQAVEIAFRVVEKSLERTGGLHDTDGFGQEAWYFMRAVGRDSGVEPYAGMDDMVLRFGSWTPTSGFGE